MTLSPAYGRDYKSLKAVKADFDADKDFIIEDIVSQWCGKPANKTALKQAGERSVQIRYGQLRKVTVLKT